MSRGWLGLAAVALPVLGTAGGIVANEAALHGASEWRIPVTGYDPRDPLRGRYIAFRYDWQARGDPGLCTRGRCRLCLEDGGRRVAVVTPTTPCAAAIDPSASGLAVGHDSARPDRVSAGTRLWVSEARAPLLERRMLAGPLVAVARLTRDGRLVPQRLEPAP